MANIGQYYSTVMANRNVNGTQILKLQFFDFLLWKWLSLMLYDICEIYWDQLFAPFIHPKLFYLYDELSIYYCSLDSR